MENKTSAHKRPLIDFKAWDMADSSAVSSPARDRRRVFRYRAK